MIHICKSKKTKEFYVVVTGNNNEILSTSELLKTKQSAWKNIRAQINQFSSSSCLVQDNTLRSKNKMIWCHSSASEKNEFATSFGTSEQTAPKIK